MSHTPSEAVIATAPGGSPSHRDFLYLATGSVAAAGVAAMIWPLVDQMNPDAATMAAARPVNIDISRIQPGQRIVALWASRPVFGVNRPQTALDEPRVPKLIARLRDPNCENLQQPAYAANWSRSVKPELLVLVGICTHLGCVPLFEPQPDPTNPAPNWPGGFFLPLPRVEIRSRGPGVTRRRRALQPARSPPITSQTTTRCGSARTRPARILTSTGFCRFETPGKRWVCLRLRAV
jgi:ubiquinol-cytochrome c reductase iron-sulfur subunit